MSRLAGLRRVAIFGVVFGGIMAVVIWSAGGVTSGYEGPRVTPVARPDDTGSVLPMRGGFSVGDGSGVHVTRDGTEVVDGQPLPYRAFEARWARQKPRPGSSSEQRRLHAEQFALLLFHLRPTPTEPRPRAIEGPDTTRIDAREAELSIREGEEFRADLVGDVTVTRHAVDGDLTLRSERLFVDAETRQASTEEHVVVEGRGAHIEGTGLDADLDTPRALLKRDVTGTFLTRPGELAGEGGVPGAAPVPATITCSGSAEVHGVGKSQKRWRVEFRENVTVVQGDRTLRCGRLEIEFRLASGTRDGLEILRSVADGNVLAEGLREDGASTYSIRAVSAETTRDAKGGNDVTFLGGTQAIFEGVLSTSGTGRVEVTCAGPAVFHTDGAASRPDRPVRSHATFRDGVVAKQWNAKTGDLETEIAAPVVSLLGARDAAAGGRLVPEALTATGSDAERVHLKRLALRAQSGNVTWTVHPEQGIERLILTGTPTASFDDTGGMNLTGVARDDQPARLLLTASNEINATYYRPEDLAPEQPLALVSATGGVVVRRIVGERESYRMSAQTTDVRVAQDRRPSSLRAHGDVLVTGRGERPGDRHVTLRGDRLSASRMGDATADPTTSTNVVVVGEPRRPASARLEEARIDGRPARVHELRAVELRYQDGGTQLIARRGARAVINRSADATEGDALSGEISILASEIRATLRESDGSATPRRTDDLLGIAASGGVTLESRRTVVTGADLTYDHVGGRAVVTGRPARALLRATNPVMSDPALSDPGLAPDANVSYDSFVHSDRIEVELAPAREGQRREVKRITCQGGRIIRYLFDDPTPETPRPLPERLRIDAEGPIELKPSGGRASGNVQMRWESLDAGHRWVQDAQLTCERVSLTFDPKATGRLQDRVTYAIAEGSARRNVVLTSSRGLRATSDRVEVRGSWLLLRSRSSNLVHVVENDPEKGRAREFDCTQGDWNYRTREWREFRRFRLY